jgi:hypothetical protein
MKIASGLKPTTLGFRIRKLGLTVELARARRKPAMPQRS